MKWLVGLLAATAGAGPVFTDVTASAGITWTHFNGESRDRFLVETTTGGLAFFDYDNDGRVDLFLVNGGETPRGRSRTPVRHALYRNLGNGRFEDVAEKAGVASPASYGMGAAACDFDNDGHQDLYVTGYPASALYRNLGNGSFRDVTAQSGVANEGEWGASAACFDYDRDGLLDLFVANYAEFSFDQPKRCDFGGEPTYCAQTAYPGRPPRLYRNEGDLRFADVSESSGVKTHSGRALGVVAIDADGDGWQDLFVARDASPNLLLLNRRDGTFVDRALDAEVAYNADGIARAGMGVDAGDVDGDGHPDFVVTNFDTEYHALYLNPGRFPYRETTVESGLAMHTRPYVGWGVRFLDFDLDGDLDLFIVNGHLHEQIEKSSRTVRYREPPLLLENDGAGKFANIKERAGAPFGAGYLSRGMATADIDDDGRLEAAFVNLLAQPVLLHNQAPPRAWLGVRLVGTRSNRDAIGAKLTVRTGDRTLTRWITGGASFLASHDRRVLFGLGDRKQPASVTITWPDGRTQTTAPLELNRYHTLTEPAS